MSRTSLNRAADGATMDGMPTAAHAKPARRDHLWVLVLIAACCLVKVWPSWIGIGAEAGFPKIGRIPTDWTLAVIIEAYWGYAVYAWLAASAGLRSRRYAMWSAIAVFALSLVGQSAAQVISATAVKVFANALPVTVLAIIAILVHLRQKDREDSRQAERRDAAAAEAATLRAELAAITETLKTTQAGRDDAQREAAEAAAASEILTRKLAAVSARNSRAKKPAVSPRGKGETSRASKVPSDFDAQAEAFTILAVEPGIKGAQLGPRVGKSARWGQMFLKGLATATADPEDGES